MKGLSHLKSMPHEYIGTKANANTNVTHQGEMIEHLLHLKCHKSPTFSCL